MDLIQLRVHNDLKTAVFTSLIPLWFSINLWSVRYWAFACAWAFWITLNTRHYDTHKLIQAEKIRVHEDPTQTAMWARVHQMDANVHRARISTALSSVFLTVFLVLDLVSVPPVLWFISWVLFCVTHTGAMIEMLSMVRN